MITQEILDQYPLDERKMIQQSLAILSRFEIWDKAATALKLTIVNRFDAQSETELTRAVTEIRQKAVVLRQLHEIGLEQARLQEMEQRDE